MGFVTPDDAVYVPVVTAQRRLFGVVNVVSSITVQAKSFALLDRAQQEIETLLRKRHKLVGEAASDFIIFNQASLAETQNAPAGYVQQSDYLSRYCVASGRRNRYYEYHVGFGDRAYP